MLRKSSLIKHSAGRLTPSEGDEKYELITSGQIAQGNKPGSHPLNLGKPRNRGGRYNPKVGTSRPKKFSTRKKGGRSASNMTLGDAASLAAMAWRGVKTIATLINVEEKIFDVQSLIANVTSSGSIVPLSEIAEGTDYNNRDGISILPQSLSVSFTVLGSSASTNFVRLITFCDNDCHGAAPLVADLLEIGGAGTNEVCISPLLHFTEKRFTIIDDFLLATSPNGPTSVVHRFTKKYNRHIYYDNTSAAAAAMWEGNLFLCMVTDQTTNGAQIVYYSRLCFTDN